MRIGNQQDLPRKLRFENIFQVRDQNVIEAGKKSPHEEERGTEGTCSASVRTARCRAVTGIVFGYCCYGVSLEGEMRSDSIEGRDATMKDNSLIKRAMDWTSCESGK